MTEIPLYHGKYCFDLPALVVLFSVKVLTHSSAVSALGHVICSTAITCRDGGRHIKFLSGVKMIWLAVISCICKNVFDVYIFWHRLEYSLEVPSIKARAPG